MCVSKTKKRGFENKTAARAREGESEIERMRERERESKRERERERERPSSTEPATSLREHVSLFT